MIAVKRVHIMPLLSDLVLSELRMTCGNAIKARKDQRFNCTEVQDLLAEVEVELRRRRHA